MVEKVKEVETSNDKLTAKVDDLEAKMKTTNDSKLSDDDLNKMVTERANLLSFAKTIVGDSLPENIGCDAMVIKKAVVEKHFNITVDGKSDAYIDARFEMVQEDQTSHDASVKKLASDLEKEKQEKQTSNDAIATDARNAYMKRKGI